MARSARALHACRTGVRRSLREETPFRNDSGLGLACPLSGDFPKWPPPHNLGAVTRSSPRAARRKAPAICVVRRQRARSGAAKYSAGIGQSWAHVDLAQGRARQNSPAGSKQSRTAFDLIWTGVNSPWPDFDPNWPALGRAWAVRSRARLGRSLSPSLTTLRSDDHAQQVKAGFGRTWCCLGTTSTQARPPRRSNMGR